MCLEMPRSSFGTTMVSMEQNTAILNQKFHSNESDSVSIQAKLRKFKLPPFCLEPIYLREYCSIIY